MRLRASSLTVRPLSRASISSLDKDSNTNVLLRLPSFLVHKTRKRDVTAAGDMQLPVNRYGSSNRTTQTTLMAVSYEISSGSAIASR